MNTPKSIVNEFLDLTNNKHDVGWKKLAEFENRSDACVIDEIYVKTPVGSTITLKIAEWFIVRDGKITEHRIYYDPREFMTAFGMQ